jgi:hypothetical protein
VRISQKQPEGCAMSYNNNKRLIGVFLTPEEIGYLDAYRTGLPGIPPRATALRKLINDMLGPHALDELYNTGGSSSSRYAVMEAVA